MDKCDYTSELDKLKVCLPISFPLATEPFTVSSTATSHPSASATAASVLTAGPLSSTAPILPACTAGSNAQGISDNLKGLCSYSCVFNHCPAGVCVCSGPAAEPAAVPELTGQHGCPDDNVAGGEDHGYYVDLYEFTCSHGYCPPGACKYC